MKQTKTYDKVLENDCAISTVVGAILVLGLIVTLTTTIQVSYVPAWKTDAEYSHMSDVWGDMADLKSNIDILSADLLIDPSSHIMMSVPVKMGGGDIPIIAAGKSSGTLSVNYKNYSMAIVANNASGAGVVYSSDSDLLDLGSISYSSNNNYYIDQMFEYENGALVVIQNERALMKLSPAITISKQDATNISIIVSAIELIGGKKTISSNTIEEVCINSNTSSVLFPSAFVSDVNIIVSTNYPTAWAQYFNTTAKRADLVYNSDYSTTVDGTNVTFILTSGADEDIQLHVQKVTVDAWIDVI